MVFKPQVFDVAKHWKTIEMVPNLIRFDNPNLKVGVNEKLTFSCSIERVLFVPSRSTLSVVAAPATLDAFERMIDCRTFRCSIVLLLVRPRQFHSDLHQSHLCQPPGRLFSNHSSPLREQPFLWKFRQPVCRGDTSKPTLASEESGNSANRTEERSGL